MPSHLMQTVYAAIYRLADAPQWLLNTEIVPAVIVLLSMPGAVCHISATGSVNGKVPRRSRIALGNGVGAAMLIVRAVVATRPDNAGMLSPVQWIGNRFARALWEEHWP